MVRARRPRPYGQIMVYPKERKRSLPNRYHCIQYYFCQCVSPSSIEPEVKIYRLTESGKEPSFLNSICDRGFSIEVGPIPQATLNADIFQKTEGLIHAMLDYLEKCLFWL